MSNGLDEAQSERLYLLLEELGEAQQAIGKILRFGYHSFEPNTGVINKMALERELGDVAVIVKMLTDGSDIDVESIDRHYEDKRQRIRQYLHHQ